MLGIAAAAIDEISGGRLVLGIGPNNEAMISRAGLSWRGPRQALRETTDTVRAALAGTGLPGLRPPRPASRMVPIHWAAMALETCEAAGRHADGLMLYLCTKDRYGRAVERMRRGAITAGRSPDDLSVSLLIPTFIHADLATARRAAREFLVLCEPGSLRQSVHGERIRSGDGSSPQGQRKSGSRGRDGRAFRSAAR
jgi:5,10-methylenetetrahydromethanopterin reductase